MKNLLLLLPLIIVFTVNGQVKDLQIDLAKLEPGKTEVIQILSNEYSGIRLKNKMVSATYEVKYELQDLVYDPFNAIAGNEVSDTCKALASLNNLLDAGEPDDKEHHEKEIPGIIKKINGILKKGDCTDENELNRATQLIDNTSTRLDFPSPVRVTRGLQFYVTVERKNDGLIWVILLKTSQPGNWKTLYGFTYVPEILSANQTYHTSAVAGADPAMYTVDKDASTRDFLTNITPTIMFTWTPGKVVDKGWKKIFTNNVYKFGVVGGIALDLESPTAMIGPTMVFADNLSISSGLIFTERSRLKSKYSLGDEVGEELDFDQLHDTGLSTYKPELFFSIAFRFKENPFSKKAEDSED